jgi:adenylylsulfate kinase
MLAEQGATVICATISMRREVYAWNRGNLPGYFEVFLDIDAETRRARDPKGYYAKISAGRLGDFAGGDQEVDLPEAPDLRITPRAGETPEATAQSIVEVLLRGSEVHPALRSAS